MTAARRVIDWRGQDAAAVARELRELPEGRYVLVPETELADVTDEAAEIQAGIDEADRGELVDWSDARDRLDGVIAAARRDR